LHHGFNTPYINTIPPEQQAPFPGNRDIERHIKSYIRWNAMAMVVKANSTTNVGGHISTYATFGGDALRSGIQSFFARAGWKFPR